MRSILSSTKECGIFLPLAMTLPMTFLRTMTLGQSAITVCGMLPHGDLTVKIKKELQPYKGWELQPSQCAVIQANPVGHACYSAYCVVGGCFQ